MADTLHAAREWCNWQRLSPLCWMACLSFRTFVFTDVSHLLTVLYCCTGGDARMSS